MKPELDLPDFKGQGEADAQNILSNHEDELAAAIVQWFQGDTTQRFDPNDYIPSADTWVPEGHSLSGMAIDCWHAAAILETTPEKYHETDRGQWLDDTCLKTVSACGISTYEHYVECLVGEALEEIANEAKRVQRLSKAKALKIIRDHLTS